MTSMRVRRTVTRVSKACLSPSVKREREVRRYQLVSTSRNSRIVEQAPVMS